MLRSEVEQAINEQINSEQTAAQGYLAISAYFEGLELKGFAKFMRHQAEEERVHAMKLFDHLAERNGQVVLQAIAAPPAEFDSPLAAFETAYEREKSNTKAIHDLYTLAGDHNDYATQSMLQWFIDEQVEEEAWCEEATSLLSMAGDDQAALLMLDDRYGARASE